MIVTIHQPDFMPWMGFFDRWRTSGCFIVLDDVQFIRRGWHHRDRIKTPQGVQWLTVPVMKSGRYEQCMRDVRLEPGATWRRKHLNTVRSCYGKAPFFGVHYPVLERAYQHGDEFLIDFNMRLLAYAAEQLGIDSPVRMASEYGCGDLRATQRLVELVGRAGGTVYLTGTGSRDYLDEAAFAARGITVEWQRFSQPEYPQLHGSFEAGLSVLDYLMMMVPGEGAQEAAHA